MFWTECVVACARRAQTRVVVRMLPSKMTEGEFRAALEALGTAVDWTMTFSYFVNGKARYVGGRCGATARLSAVCVVKA